MPAGHAEGDAASTGGDRPLTTGDDDVFVGSGPDDGLTRAERRRLRSR